MNQQYICPRCGLPVPYGKNFCSNCGMQVQFPQGMPGAYPSSPENTCIKLEYYHGKYYPVPEQKKSMPAGFIILSIAAMLMILLGGIILVVNIGSQTNKIADGGKQTVAVSGNPTPPPITANVTQNQATPTPRPQVTEGPSMVQIFPNNSPPGNSQKPDIVIADFEKQLHNLINVERQKNNLKPLAWNDTVGSVARNHSADMAQRNYFDHNTPEGYNVSYRLKQGGYTITVGCGENIFKCPEAKSYWYRNDGTITNIDYYQIDEMAQVIVQGWMNSAGHRANILNPSWTAEGIGVAVSADNYVYITEDFV
jgi:uncharacterized protein YkwD